MRIATEPSVHECSSRTWRPLAAWLALAFMVAVQGHAAAQEEPYRRVGDLTAYLGVIPAQVVWGHQPGHPEAAMHGGSPGGRHDVHLTVALFETESGRRIENADVSATVSGLGQVGATRLRLAPMAIADTVTYGGYVALPGSDRYTIALEIRRMGIDTPMTAEFTYDHRR